MITCDQTDYIEIACMFRYPVKITMQSGSILQCVALDTRRNENGEECMKVEANGTDELIVLDNIAKLEVCIENPHFQTISFS